MRPALTNALTNAIREALNYSSTSLEPEPVINYVARLDGFSQHWVLSSPFTVSEGQRLEVSVFGVTTTNERMTLFGQYAQDGDSLNIHDRGQVHFRTGDGHVSDLSLDGSTPSIIADPFKYDGLSHEVVATIRNGFTVSTDKFGAAANGGLFRYYLSGAVYNIKHYDVDGTLLLDLPLTNKSQGATQLAIVGNISATMLNYTEDVWEKLPVATGIFGARLNGTSQQWNLSAPISTSEGDYFAFDFSISSDAGTFGDYKRILGSDSDYGVRLGVRSGGTTGSFELVRVAGTLDGEDIVNSEGIPNDRALKTITVTPEKAGDFKAIGGLATVADRSFAGVVANFRHYNSDGVLLHEIPLTNKEQGATQLGTVGGINATMMDFNENTWEELYSAS